MQISFYVLCDAYIANHATASNSEAVATFVCKLTQTVLKKSEHSLVIIDDDIARLQQLDKHLWAFEPESFVPHELILPAQHQVLQPDQSPQQAISATDGSDIDLSAPVTLLTKLPQGFDGVVLNLAKAPLPLPNLAQSNSSQSSPAQQDTQNAQSRSMLDRVLEIITPDEQSKEEGRNKYRYYRDLGFELTYFPMS